MEGPGAASGRRALSQRPFLPYRLLPPRAVSPRLIFPYSALHLPLSFLTPRRIPPFFPCSAPHFPPFFPRFTSHLSARPSFPAARGRKVFAELFPKSDPPVAPSAYSRPRVFRFLYSPLLCAPFPVFPPTRVFRFLYSHPPVCCVFASPPHTAPAIFLCPGLTDAVLCAILSTKNTVLQRRQFVTILSVNKTREKDGRIAPFLFCRVWERGQNRPAKKEGAPCAEKGKKNGKKNMKPIACC